jgi:hypothetical protein
MRRYLRSAGTQAAALGVACAIYSGQSVASTIVAPVSAFATSQFNSGNINYSIGNTINQSGLSLGYASGITDFGSYLATHAAHTSSAKGTEWFSRDYNNHARQNHNTRKVSSHRTSNKRSNIRVSGLTVTYRFSELTPINGFALWNEEFAGIGTTQLLSSMDGITFSLLGIINPVPSTFAPDGKIVPYAAQVFSFDLTTMLFFRLLIADCPGPPSNQSSYRGCGIGEIAFSAVPRGPQDSVPVPLPASLPLLGSMLGVFFWLGQRKNNSPLKAG